jgi:phosphoglycerate dehydrogenase-like enzyme
MADCKLLVFAPRDEPAALLKPIEDAGVTIEKGDPAWQWDQRDHEPAFIAAARDSAAMMGSMVRCAPITRGVLESAQRLRVVAKYTVGVDDVDVDAATDLGILVCHAPTEANCFGVAETTMTLMLTVLKKVRERDQHVRNFGWRQPSLANTYVGSRISDGFAGVTVGIVGLGRIGQRVAQLLAPWRVRVIAYDPYAPPARFLLSGVERVDYETLLRESDVVSFHVTLTAETRFMMDEKELALIKPTAIVINTARGKVIRETALAKAIQEQRLRGAALDVFEFEPLPKDSPLRDLGDRILLSPHAASYTEGGELRPGMVWAVKSVLTALRGEVPDNVYNTEVIPRWKERFGGSSAIG